MCVSPFIFIVSSVSRFFSSQFEYYIIRARINIGIPRATIIWHAVYSQLKKEIILPVVLSRQKITLLLFFFSQRCKLLRTQNFLSRRNFLFIYFFLSRVRFVSKMIEFAKEFQSAKSRFRETIARAIRFMSSWLAPKKKKKGRSALAEERQWVAARQLERQVWKVKFIST